MCQSKRTEQELMDKYISYFVLWFIELRPLGLQLKCIPPILGSLLSSPLTSNIVIDSHVLVAGCGICHRLSGRDCLPNMKTGN